MKALREGFGKSLADVHTSRLCSKASLVRIENGSNGRIKVDDITGQCWLYGVDRVTVDTLVELAQQTSATAGGRATATSRRCGFGTYVELGGAARRAYLLNPNWSLVCCLSAGLAATRWRYIVGPGLRG